MPILLSSISMLWAMMGPILRVYYSQSIPVKIGAPDHIKLMEALAERGMPKTPPKQFLLT
jgi:hypothetical protein